jgi:hypothetical protein
LLQVALVFPPLDAVTYNVQATIRSACVRNVSFRFGLSPWPSNEPPPYASRPEWIVGDVNRAIALPFNYNLKQKTTQSSPMPSTSYVARSFARSFVDRVHRCFVCHSRLSFGISTSSNPLKCIELAELTLW